jgi:3-oxoadipate enol-lactonase
LPYRCIFGFNEANLKIEIGGLTFNFKSEGQGSCLAILHGIGGSLQEFDTIVPALKKKWRVLRYDQRGFGKSSKPLDKPYSLEVWADDLHSLQSKLRIRKMVVAGHSMGGRIACRFAAKYPEETIALIAISTTMWGSNHDAAIRLRESITRCKTEGIGAFFQNTTSYQNLEKRFPAIAKRLKQQRLTNDVDAYSMAAESVAADFSGETDYDFLKQISCPTLILVGDVDTSVLLGAAEMRRLIPGSRFGVIPDCSHFPHLESPRILSSMFMEFLSQLS